MPSGAGKSAIYQLAAIALGGPAVVVSPLLSLQRDQADHLRSHGLTAVAVNANAPESRRAVAYDLLRDGQAGFVFLAPEQLARDDVRDVLAEAPPEPAAAVEGDADPAAEADEWSGDAGSGVQYFSQQAVSRLADRAGFQLPADMAAPERLIVVQEAMASGDPRAEQLYDTIGSYLGYSIGHYADFYHLRHVLVMGRVTSGTGGERILLRAREVLAAEFPSVASRTRVRMPDEKDKRHGQAIAAASLPSIDEIAGSHTARSDSR